MLSISEAPSTSHSAVLLDTHPPTSQNADRNQRTLLSSTHNTSLFNDRKMATTITLTAVAAPGTNNTNSSSSNSSTDSNKRRSEETLAPSPNRKPTHRRVTTPLQADSSTMKTAIKVDDSDGLNKANTLNRSTPTFRIPKLGR